jgi:hypothetical protein
MQPNSRFVVTALGLAAALPGVFLAGAAAEAPPIASGYVERVRTGFDTKRQPLGDRRSERVWFSGRSSRTDELIDDHVSLSSVRGPVSWTAYPEAGRVFEMKTDDRNQEPYPAEVRRTYARLFKQRERSGEAAVGKYPAWKYAWHEPARVAGDIGSAAADVTYLVHASEDFPVILEDTAAYEGGGGSRQTLVALKLRDAVPNDIFAKPKGLKPVLPFQLSGRVFRLELEKERNSTRYGWKVNQFEVYAGDGKQVSFTHRQELTDADGVVTVTGGAAQALNYGPALQQLSRELQAPPWSTVKLTGRERILGLEADLLENYVPGLAKATYSVVDHPQLGTFTIRHTSVDENERSSATVKVLHVEATPAG